jgi:hypothetical protein
MELTNSEIIGIVAIIGFVALGFFIGWTYGSMTCSYSMNII